MGLFIAQGLLLVGIIALAWRFNLLSLFNHPYITRRYYYLPKAPTQLRLTPQFNHQRVRPSQTRPQQPARAPQPLNQPTQLRVRKKYKV